MSSKVTKTGLNSQSHERQSYGPEEVCVGLYFDM